MTIFGLVVLATGPPVLTFISTKALLSVFETLLSTTAAFMPLGLALLIIAFIAFMVRGPGSAFMMSKVFTSFCSCGSIPARSRKLSSDSGAPTAVIVFLASLIIGSALVFIVTAFLATGAAGFILSLFTELCLSTMTFSTIRISPADAGDNSFFSAIAYEGFSTFSTSPDITSFFTRHFGNLLFVDTRSTKLTTPPIV